MQVCYTTGSALAWAAKRKKQLSNHFFGQNTVILSPPLTRTQRYIDIHITDIPPEYEDLQSDIEFNPDDMKRLFEYGYNRSVNGQVWWTQPAVENYQELIERVDPAEAIEEMEARPGLRRLEMWRPKE
jgi:hypothetical protein